MNFKIKKWHIFLTLVTAIGLSFTAFTKNSSTRLHQPLEFACNPERSLLYELEYQSKGLSNNLLFQGQEESSQTVRAAVNGTMQQQCIQSENDRMVYKLRFNDVNAGLSVESGGIFDSDKDLSAELTSPFFIELDRFGKIEEIVFDEHHSNESQHLIRDLISRANLILSSEKNNSWETDENDLNGSFKALYELGSINKEKQAAITKTREYAEKEKTVDENSQARFVFDTRHGEIHSIESEINFSFTQNRQLIAEFKTTFSQKLKTAETASTAKAIEKKEYGDAIKQGRSASVSGSEVWANIDSNIQKKELGNDTAKTLMEKIEHGESEDSLKTYLKLKALFILHPESPLEFSHYLTDSDMQSAQFSTVLSACVSVGSEMCQNVLQSAYETVDEKSKKAILMAHIGLLESPTIEIENVVLNETKSQLLDKEMIFTSRLTLGNIAGAVKESDRDRCDRLFEELKTFYLGAAEYDEKQNAIAALGNAGHPENLNILRDDIQSEDDFTRRNAVAALRFIPGNDAEETIIESIQSDASADVRLEAVNSFQYREISEPVVNVLATALKTDHSQNVRIAVLHKLSNLMDAFPAAKEDIKGAAQNDASKEVRMFAENILIKSGV